MSKIRYILLILMIFTFIDICAQNVAQNSINCAIDSLKLEKYGNSIPILESKINEVGISQKQFNHAQMLLEIAYFYKGSLKFDLLRLENSVNLIEYDDPFNIKGYIALMELNSNLKNYEKGLYWGKKGLSLFDNSKNSVYYAELSGEMADCYYSLTNYPKAIIFYTQALQIIKENYENNNKSCWYWLSKLASCFAELGDYKKAIEIELQSLVRDENFAIAFSYLNLSNYYLKIGDINKHKEYLSKYNNSMWSPELEKAIAFEYQKNNKDAVAVDYQKSIENQKNKIEHSKKQFGENSKSYAAALEKLASLYSTVNCYQEAIIKMLNVVTIYKNLYSESDRRYLTAMSNLALYYGKNQDYSKALEIGNAVLQAQQKAIEIADSTRITSLNKLDFFSNSFLFLYDRYRDIAVSLHNLAFYHSALGDYDNAIMLDSDAILILKKVGNEGNYDDTRPMETLASYYLATKNFVYSFNLMNQLFSIRKGIINDKFLIYDEEERTNFWDNLKNSYESNNPSYSYDCIQYNPSVTGFAYDNELFKKGLLLNTFMQFKRSILESSDTILINRWVQYQNLKYKILQIAEKSTNEQSQIDSLQLKAKKLDNELAKKSSVYLKSKKDLNVCWEDIQSNIKEGEAVFEFSSFRYFHKDWTDSTLYCVLVLKKEMKFPLMISLFEQKQLDSLFVGVTAEPNFLYASRGVETTYNPIIPNGKKLYDLIWKPLEEYLADVKTVYYSPSGTLHQVAFAALPIDTISYLCDKYNLVQLSSTRQLATSEWQSTPSQISNATLFGGIKYDLEPQEIAELQRSTPLKEKPFSRGFVSDSTFCRGSINALKGTKIEVDSISVELQSKNINTTLYTGIGANEQTFKSLTNQNIGVLHIATHGFFFPDIKEKPEEMDRFMLAGEQRFRNTPNPLLRSGLILAGGNRAWQGKEPFPGLEDGILTAQEISEMYLPNTELVVLSACETGLGDIQGGEGVFGLQRAFKLAGAKSILMSLWKVPDSETAEMMQSFYGKWLAGMDRREAFRFAQKELRNKYPKEPYKWAGFVMVD
jgi:CHAT domain-containing protein